VIGKTKTSPLINADDTDRNGITEQTAEAAPHAHGPRQSYAKLGPVGMSGYKCFGILVEGYRGGGGEIAKIAKIAGIAKIESWSASPFRSVLISGEVLARSR
jgi:hypothetical protein